MIEVKKNFDIKKIYEDKRKEAEIALDKGIQELAGEIVKRTQEGKNVDGTRMDAYSRGYQKYREKVGRKGATTDLTLTGGMLKAISTTIERVGRGLIAKIFITPTPGSRPPQRKSFKSTNAQEKARYVQKRGNRQFFGLSKEQIARVVKLVNEAMKK